MIEKREDGDTLFFGYCNPTTGKLEWKAENKDEYDYFTGNDLLLYNNCCLLFIFIRILLSIVTLKMLNTFV